MPGALGIVWIRPDSRKDFEAQNIRDAVAVLRRECPEGDRDFKCVVWITGDSGDAPGEAGRDQIVILVGLSSKIKACALIVAVFQPEPCNSGAGEREF